MLSYGFVLFLLVSNSFCATSYDFDQIKDAAESHVRYLKSIEDYFTQNATELTGYVTAQLISVYFTSPVNEYITPYENETIRYFIEAFLPEIENYVLGNPCDNRSVVLFRPQYWAPNNEYFFIKGRIPTMVEPTNETLDEIYLKSRYTSYGLLCKTELVRLNGRSDEVRDCILPCPNILDDDSIATITDKTFYIIDGILTNCSQYTPEIAKAISTGYCIIMYQQVITICRRYADNEKLDDTLFYFLLQVLICGSYGFPEFYDREIITVLFRLINIDGSVGSSRRTLEEKAVLTTQSLIILTSILRMTLQEKYVGI